MKKNLWISISAAVILIAAVVCFVYIYHQGVSSKNTQQAQNNIQPKTKAFTIPATAATGAKDPSDVSINEDLANIDAQMSSLKADTANMDSSLSNQ